MASLYDYPATPGRLVPNGLQTRADWGLPSPTSPPSRIQSSSPVSYAPSSYDCCYQPHDPRDCVHARLLCDKRFADIQAMMADLERCPCRHGCGQSTWGRTKSFFGGLKKRALSIRGRKKSQDSHELEQAHDHEWPGVGHPSATAAELPAFCRLSELDPNQTFTPELASTSSPANHPHESSGLAAGMDLYSPASIPCAQYSGEGQLGYGLNASMASLSPPALQSQLQVPPVHELPAHMPRPIPHQATWYSAPTTAQASFAVVSPISPSTLSSPGSHSLVSPQSSMSSVPLSLRTDATSIAAAGAPIFSEHTTASPVEYGQDYDIAPWDRQPPTAHQNSWDSATTLAELPGSYDTGSKPGHWLQRPLNGQLAELEGAMPLLSSSAVPIHQFFGDVQPMQPAELATGVDVQSSPVTSPWRLYMSETTSMEKQPVMPSPNIGNSHFPSHPPAPRLQPRPILSRSQRSYDSTTSTVLDVPTPDDFQTAAISAACTPPQKTSFIYELPSQQKPAPAKRRAPPPKHRKLEQEEQRWCEACDFRPSPTGWRRKMEKHNKTDGHRKRTGQLLTETDKYPCLHCPSAYNRRDNMRQHARVVHGIIEQSPGRTRGRRRQAGREVDR